MKYTNMIIFIFFFLSFFFGIKSAKCHKGRFSHIVALYILLTEKGYLKVKKRSLRGLAVKLPAL